MSGAGRYRSGRHDRAALVMAAMVAPLVILLLDLVHWLLIQPNKIQRWVTRH